MIRSTLSTICASATARPPLLGEAGAADAAGVLELRREDPGRPLAVDPPREDHPPLRREDPRRAGLVAGAAAVAPGDVHVAGFVADLDLEVADVALDRVELRPRHQPDARVLPDRHHLRGEDAGGAVEGGERLV